MTGGGRAVVTVLLVGGMVVTVLGVGVVFLEAGVVASVE